MIDVFIVDDHAIVRQGVKQIIAETRDMRIVGETGNAVEANRKINEANPDVVVLDISMPGKSGVDILKQIKEHKPNVAALILSMYPEDQYAVRLMKYGASGYLTKESAPESLVSAIRTIASGKKYISPVVSELMLSEMVDETSAPPHKQLSSREYQVFLLLVAGKTMMEIAGEMCLSVKTIGTYRARLLQKLNIRNNVELTHYAIKNGFSV